MKPILLILFLLSSLSCLSQRSSPYFTSSRIIKSNCESFGNDTDGYFTGQVVLDSSHKLLQPNKGTISIISVNQATYALSSYSINNDSGNFNIRLSRGYYAISIIDPGFQPLIINGFHSYPNQTLYIRAVLEPGNSKSIYTIDSSCVIKKYVPSKPSWIGAFYYGDFSDTTVALLWGELFLDTVSAAGDSSIMFGKVSIKYKCIETGDTGRTESNVNGSFSIYFKDGHYNLTISKPGYQSVVIKNYNAYEAQGSYLDAVLELGNNESVFTINNEGKIEREQ